jgi:hypothetical protein
MAPEKPPPREQNPNYNPYTPMPMDDNVVLRYLVAFDIMRQHESTPPTIRQLLQLHRRWVMIVTMYTFGQLTNPTDCLVGMPASQKPSRTTKKD